MMWSPAKSILNLNTISSAKILVLSALLLIQFAKASDAFEQTRSSIATGRGNIFRPSYVLGIPRYIYNSNDLTYAMKRSAGPFVSASDVDAEQAVSIENMKRSAALGRSRFRPGKRAMITMEEYEDMPVGFNLLSEAQMGKRGDYFPLGMALQNPWKRSMAVGRSGFRPGKRSIATGRTGFRPGKRSAFSELDQLDASEEQML
jgi:hypothetical protein